jgi:hypothetical protein
MIASSADSRRSQEMNTSPMKSISGLPVCNVIPTPPRLRQEIHGGYLISLKRDSFNPQGLKRYPGKFLFTVHPASVRK